MYDPIYFSMKLNIKTSLRLGSGRGYFDQHLICVAVFRRSLSKVIILNLIVRISQANEYISVRDVIIVNYFSCKIHCQ